MNQRLAQFGFWVLLMSAMSTAVGVARAGDVGETRVEALQLRLLTDDQFLDALYGLSGDETVRAVLDDPEIQQQIKAGDTAALLQNPKMQALSNDPRVQGLTKELAK